MYVTKPFTINEGDLLEIFCKNDNEQDVMIAGFIKASTPSNPNYQIDITAEQSALLRHELIILQCPMYWFSIPAILKIWFDQVFTYQFAYGSKGDKLKNKKLLLSMTIGQPEQNFSTEQQHSLLEDFLSPIQKSALYTGMEYLEPVFLYDISTVLGHTHTEIRTRAKQHSLKLNHYLQTIDSD
jgi:glutathione-regulated potassium-efflux system ancillary protein KefF